MKRSLLVVLVVLLGFLVLFSGLSVGEVAGVSYYNWVRNSSFESDVNMIEDCGFESGAFNSGLVYGNWSGTGAVVGTNPNTGVYHAEITTGEILWYNFTDEILGADVEVFTFYGYSNVDCTLNVVYSDESSDSDTVTLGAGGYTLEDEVGLIDGEKFVVALKFVGGSGWAFLDDFFLSVYDGENLDAQDEVDWFSEPWYWYGYTDAWDMSDVTDSELTDNVAHGGNQSYMINPAFGYTVDYPLYQDFMGLAVDDVVYVDFWIYVMSDDVEVTFSVWYSDGGHNNKVVEVDDTDGWEHINLGRNWLRSGALITSLHISVSGLEQYYCFLDDVGIWADVPLGQSRFSWYVVPSPVGGYSGFSCTLYASTSYTLYGSVYDDDGDLAGNGSCAVYLGDSVGWKVVDIVDGQFNVVVGSRRSFKTATYEQWTVGMSYQIDGEWYAYDVAITVLWSISDVDDDGDGVVDYDGSGGNWFANEDFQWLLLSMFVMFTPAMGFASILHKDAPVQGFFVGLAIGSTIMMMTGFGTFYFMLLSALAIGMLFVTMLSRS